jgi:hypothetical protein
LLDGVREFTDIGFPSYEPDPPAAFCVNFRNLEIRGCFQNQMQKFLQNLPQFENIIKRNCKSPELLTIGLVLLLRADR